MTSVPDLTRIPDLIELSILGMCLFKLVPRLYEHFSVPWIFRMWAWGSVGTAFSIVLLVVSVGDAPNPFVLLYQFALCCWIFWVPGGLLGLLFAKAYRLLAGESAPKLLGCSQHLALTTEGTLAERSRKQVILHSRPSGSSIFFYVAGLPSMMLGALTLFGLLIGALIGQAVVLLSRVF